MTQSQLRKLNVIIQKKMMTSDQSRLLITLMLQRTTTLADMSDIYYGPVKDKDKPTTMRIGYIKKYLKELILKFDYWGLPFVIVLDKKGNVQLTVKEEADAK
jgi:hypothetical protein